jgi:putative addiction module CopG family antidote
MAEGLNIRISGKLRNFVEMQTGESGLFESVSEYIRSLIREDFERSQQKKWDALYEELKDGIDAPDHEFVAFSAEDIKAEGRRLSKTHDL